MFAMIVEALGKRRLYGEPYTRAPTLKCVHFVKNGYGFRLMAVTSMSATFNKFALFAFSVYTSRSFLVPMLNFQKLKFHTPCYGYAYEG